MKKKKMKIGKINIFFSFLFEINYIKNKIILIFFKIKYLIPKYFIILYLFN
jgi:hypothetical protein